MEEEIFVVSDKLKLAKALGIPLDVDSETVRVYIDGVEVTKHAVWEEIRVTAERKKPAPADASSSPASFVG